MGEVKHPVVPMRRGEALGSGVMAVFGMAAVVVTSIHRLEALAGVVLLAVLMWFVVRGVARIVGSVIPDLDRVQGPIVGDHPRAFRRGVLHGVAFGTVVLLVAGAWWWLRNDLALPILVAPLIYCFGSLGAATHLRGWQDETGSELFTRAAPSLVAWTRAQARARLVIVDQHSTSVATERADP